MPNREASVFFDAETFCADGQVQRAAINVDCLNDSELDALIAHPAAHAEVRRYAEMLKHCRARRLRGDMGPSLERDEARLERIYAVLPAHLRW